MKDETATWIESAERDLQAAELMLAEGFYAQCVFYCQQGVEKALKGHWIERAREGVPPRKHDLRALAVDAGLQLGAEQEAFLDDLYAQYKPSRYPDVAIEYERQEAAHYRAGAGEFVEWLRRRLS